MRRTTRRRRAITIGAMVVLGAVTATAVEAGAADAWGARYAGRLTAYSAVPNNPTAGAWATVYVTSGDGRGTLAGLVVKGFAASETGRTFGAHFHTGPCADGVSAGPHYTNPVAAETLEDREIWLDFTVAGNGSAYAVTHRSWSLPSGAARSLVVHADPTAPTGAAGTRLACLPLGG